MKKAQGVYLVLFRLVACDKARDTVHENVLRFRCSNFNGIGGVVGVKNAPCL